MMRIWIGSKELPNGPFPITERQLRQARTKFRALQSTRFAGVAQAPQTVARGVLREVAPTLTSFDVLSLGYAVTSRRIRIEVQR